jgi:hypothetical protein
LFSLYINDISSNIHRVKLVLFVDGTIILVDKNEDALQQKVLYVMKELEIWFQKKCYFINIKKTVAVFFYPNQFRLPNKPRVVFNNMEVACKPEVRVLGIYITENVKWNSMTVHYVQV